MREYEKHIIAIHCSATDNKKYDNIATMRRWHKAKGWRDVGYNYFIRKDGTIEAPYGREIYSLTHIIMNLHRFTEKQIVIIFIFLQSVVSFSVLLLYLLNLI